MGDDGDHRGDDALELMRELKKKIRREQAEGRPDGSVDSQQAGGSPEDVGCNSDSASQQLQDGMRMA